MYDVSEPTADVLMYDVSEPTAAVQMDDVSEPAAVVQMDDNVSEPAAAVQMNDVVSEPAAAVQMDGDVPVDVCIFCGGNFLNYRPGEERIQGKRWGLRGRYCEVYFSLLLVFKVLLTTAHRDLQVYVPCLISPRVDFKDSTYGTFRLTALIQINS